MNYYQNVAKQCHEAAEAFAKASAAYDAAGAVAQQYVVQGVFMGDTKHGHAMFQATRDWKMAVREVNMAIKISDRWK
jgi:hypothetical protein